MTCCAKDERRPKFELGDDVERVQVNGAIWYRGVVAVATSEGLQVDVTEVIHGPDVGDWAAAPIVAHGLPCWRHRLHTASCHGDPHTGDCCDQPERGEG
jgi:hypothetical protein